MELAASLCGLAQPPARAVPLELSSGDWTCFCRLGEVLVLDIVIKHQKNFWVPSQQIIENAGIGSGRVLLCS